MLRQSARYHAKIDSKVPVINLKTRPWNLSTQNNFIHITVIIIALTAFKNIKFSDHSSDHYRVFITVFTTCNSSPFILHHSDAVLFCSQIDGVLPNPADDQEYKALLQFFRNSRNNGQKWSSRWAEPSFHLSMTRFSAGMSRFNTILSLNGSRSDH